MWLFRKGSIFGETDDGSLACSADQTLQTLGYAPLFGRITLAVTVTDIAVVGVPEGEKCFISVSDGHTVVQSHPRESKDGYKWSEQYTFETDRFSTVFSIQLFESFMGIHPPPIAMYQFHLVPHIRNLLIKTLSGATLDVADTVLNYERPMQILHVPDRCTEESFKPNIMIKVKYRFVDMLRTIPHLITDPTQMALREIYDPLHIEGTIRIHIHEARDLASKDIGGKSDPYCIVKVNHQKQRSATVSNSLNPNWNFQTRFVVPISKGMIQALPKFNRMNENPESESKTQQLIQSGHDVEPTFTLSVYDEDMGFRDDFLGQYKVPIHQFMAQAQEDSVQGKIGHDSEGMIRISWTGWVVLERKKRKSSPKGQVYISITLSFPDPFLVLEHMGEGKGMDLTLTTATKIKSFNKNMIMSLAKARSSIELPVHGNRATAFENALLSVLRPLLDKSSFSHHVDQMFSNLELRRILTSAFFVGETKLSLIEERCRERCQRHKVFRLLIAQSKYLDVVPGAQAKSFQSIELYTAWEQYQKSRIMKLSKQLMTEESCNTFLLVTIHGFKNIPPPLPVKIKLLYGDLKLKTMSYQKGSESTIGCSFLIPHRPDLNLLQIIIWTKSILKKGRVYAQGSVSLEHTIPCEFMSHTVNCRLNEASTRSSFASHPEPQVSLSLMLFDDLDYPDPDPQTRAKYAKPFFWNPDSTSKPDHLILLNVKKYIDFRQKVQIEDGWIMCRVPLLEMSSSPFSRLIVEGAYAQYHILVSHFVQFESQLQEMHGSTFQKPIVRQLSAPSQFVLQDFALRYGVPPFFRLISILVHLIQLMTLSTQIDERFLSSTFHEFVDMFQDTQTVLTKTESEAATYILDFISQEAVARIQACSVYFHSFLGSDEAKVWTRILFKSKGLNPAIGAEYIKEVFLQGEKARFSSMMANCKLERPMELCAIINLILVDLQDAFYYWTALRLPGPLLQVEIKYYFTEVKLHMNKIWKSLDPSSSSFISTAVTLLLHVCRLEVLAQFLAKECEIKISGGLIPLSSKVCSHLIKGVQMMVDEHVKADAWDPTQMDHAVTTSYRACLQIWNGFAADMLLHCKVGGDFRNLMLCVLCGGIQGYVCKIQERVIAAIIQSQLEPSSVRESANGIESLPISKTEKAHMKIGLQSPGSKPVVSTEYLWVNNLSQLQTEFRARCTSFFENETEMNDAVTLSTTTHILLKALEKVLCRYSQLYLVGMTKSLVRFLKHFRYAKRLTPMITDSEIATLGHEILPHVAEMTRRHHKITSVLMERPKEQLSKALWTQALQVAEGLVWSPPLAVEYLESSGALKLYGSVLCAFLNIFLEMAQAESMMPVDDSWYKQEMKPFSQLVELFGRNTPELITIIERKDSQSEGQNSPKLHGPTTAWTQRQAKRILRGRTHDSFVKNYLVVLAENEAPSNLTAADWSLTEFLEAWQGQRDFTLFLVEGSVSDDSESTECGTFHLSSELIQFASKDRCLHLSWQYCDVYNVVQEPGIFSSTCNVRVFGKKGEVVKLCVSGRKEAESFSLAVKTLCAHYGNLLASL
eukprot:TRINITY_DN9062_c0_g1_i2.p1 TRINITY_DN9062_c0_g1~~TRINITY_DN9062_c0_g1_i2.p1  ORF type:complete len:1548 (+),score=270.11 TRINITY_DN9062_c0_g1_i2:60-4703(+)